MVRKLRAVVSRILAHFYDALSTPDLLSLLARLEHETRRLPVPGHALNQSAQRPGHRRHADPARVAVIRRFLDELPAVGGRRQWIPSPHLDHQQPRTNTPKNSPKRRRR